MFYTSSVFWFWFLLSLTVATIIDYILKKKTDALKDRLLRQIDQLLQCNTSEFKNLISVRSRELRAITNIKDVVYAYFYIKGIITPEPNIQCQLEYKKSILHFVPFIKFGITHRDPLTRTKMLVFMEHLIKVAVLLELGVLSAEHKKQYLQLYSELPTTEFQLDNSVKKIISICEMKRVKICKETLAVLLVIKLSEPPRNNSLGKSVFT